MRRPWELGHTDRVRGGGPRVYVPVSLPDTSSATFAVLELVGFSSSPSSSCVSSASPSHQADTLLSVPLHSPSHPLFAGLHAPNSLAAIESSLIKENSLQSSQSIPPVSEIDFARFATTAGAIAAFSATVEANKSATWLPPGSGGRAYVVKTAMKESVVHTTSLNFKDVVQKLTGASGKAEDMLPVTLPNRSVIPTAMSSGSCKSTSTTTSKVLDALSVKMDAGKALKRSSSCKLLERRKGALRNLEQLHTEKPISLSASALTWPLSPSPITPLTSYFEKFCNAITPTPSPSSNTSSPARQPVPQPDFSSMPDCTSPSSATARGAKTLNKQQCAAISLQPALCAGPPLLSLFPESPISSPQRH